MSFISDNGWYRTSLAGGTCCNVTVGQGCLIFPGRYRHPFAHSPIMSAASPEVLGGADLLLSVGQREREREGERGMQAAQMQGGCGI